jgi:DHA3 family macrolide efflux protein-like MFS transporter
MATSARPASLRPFLFVWTGQAFSLFGSELVHFALSWYLARETGSAIVLTTANLVGRLPYIVLGPYIGALVDRWNRRTVMIVADGLTALTTLMIAYLFMTGAVQIWHVYALLFVRALDNAFQTPAMQASTSLMVPEEHLSRVAGLNQGLAGAINIIGPLAGAALFELVPIQAILSIDIITAAIAIGMLFAVAIPQPERKAEQASQTAFRDMVEGFRYLWTWPGMMILLGAAAIMNFFISPAFSLMPILITKHFQGGAPELAWLQAASGGGIIAGGLLLGVWGGFKRRIITSLMGLFLLGGAAVGLGLIPANLLVIAVVCSLLAGAAMPIANGPLMALMQAIIPPDKQARVFALDLAISISITPIGLLAAGAFAEALGVQWWFIVSGAVVVVVAIAMALIPAVMRIEDRGKTEEVEAVTENPEQASALADA